MPNVSTLFALSLVMLLGSMALVPWVLALLPADYFSNPHHRPLERFDARPALRWGLLAIKNALGLVFLLAGLAMLVLPGQGLLTLLAAFILLDFPGKFTLKKRLISWPPIHRIANRLRKRQGREPFS